MISLIFKGAKSVFGEKLTFKRWMIAGFIFTAALALWVQMRDLILNAALFAVIVIIEEIRERRSKKSI
jgi:hypothetical protein